MQVMRYTYEKIVPSMFFTHGSILHSLIYFLLLNVIIGGIKSVIAYYPSLAIHDLSATLTSSKKKAMAIVSMI